MQFRGLLAFVVLMLIGVSSFGKSSLEDSYSYISVDGTDSVKIAISGFVGEQGDTLCADFSVENFCGVCAMQFTINFDPSVIQAVCPPTNLNLFGLTTTSFNCNSADEGFITLVYFEPNVCTTGGVTVPDGTQIFSICFELVGDPGESSVITITGDKTEVEIIQVIDGTEEIFDDFALCDTIGQITCETLSVIENHCPATSNGSSDGFINFFICGGTGPYSYDVNGGLFSGSGITDLEEINLLNLAMGVYTITITDASGAMNSVMITIDENVPITFDLIPRDPSCYNRDDGRVTIENIAGGDSPYFIEWSTFEFNNDEIRDLSSGDYSVTVTDLSGCTSSDVININIDTLKAVAMIKDSASCPGVDDGSVIITAMGGTPYTGGEYTFNGVGPAVNYCAENVASGYFYFQVEDAALPQCESELDSILMPFKTNLMVDIQTVDVSCLGDTDGQVVITGVGGTNYAFQVWNGMGGNVPNGISTTMTYTNMTLAPDTYTVRITDFTGGMAGCFIDTFFTISQPELLVMSKDSINPSCIGNDGSVTLSAEGGTGPYIYKWDDGFEGDFRDNLNGGIPYMITVCDSRGCVDSTTINLVMGGNINLDAVVQQAISCDDTADGVITVNIFTPGTFNIMWADDNGPISDQQTVSNLSGGVYYVTVSDVDCIAMDTVILATPSPIDADIVYTLPSCPKFSNGSLGAMPFGGAGPYMFSWKDKDGNELSTGSVLGAIPAGQYLLTIEDLAGCTFDTCVTLDSPPAIDLSVDNLTAITCNGTDDAQASAIAMGGTVNNGTYFFLWSSGETTIGATSTAVNLGPGNQWVIASDTECPSDTLFFEIEDISRIEVDLANSIITEPSCFGDCDGSITASAMGGLPPYSFSWVGGINGPTVTDICSGQVLVMITDANNCTVFDSIFVGQPDSLELIIDPFATADLSCANSNGGQIGVTPLGGTPDFGYNWSNSSSTTNTATDLGPGLYEVTVTDANMCTDSISYSLFSPPPIFATIISPEEPDCFGGRTCIEVTNAFGGSGAGYTFTINQGIRFPLDTCIEVFAGPYTVNVFDDAGCFFDTMFVIDQPDMIEVDLGDDFEINLGEDTGPIEANIVATLGIDSIFWDQEVICETIDCDIISASPTETTTYSILVQDENGCTAFDDITVSVRQTRNLYAANIFSPNGDGINDYFQLKAGPGVENILYLRIFDRWGNQMFVRENYLPLPEESGGWDGTYKQERVNPGVYVYIAEVEFIDGRRITYKGDITLIR